MTIENAVSFVLNVLTATGVVVAFWLVGMCIINGQFW